MDPVYSASGRYALPGGSPLPVHWLHDGHGSVLALALGGAALGAEPLRGDALAALARRSGLKGPEDERPDPVLDTDLAAYFRGERVHWRVRVQPTRGTPFQKRVWRALAEIPWGSVRSYGELARAAGVPAAVRAVGAACGANPLPLLVPCHRVVRSNGDVGGFGPGPAVKRRLLGLEGVDLEALRRAPALRTSHH